MRRQIVRLPAALVAAVACLSVTAAGALAATPATTTTSTTPSTTTTVATPTTTTPTTTTTTTTTPVTTKPKKKKPAAPKPVNAQAKVYLFNAFQVDKHTVDVPNRNIQVSGYVHPYVAGQTVTVTADLGTKQVAKQTVRLRALKSGRSGSFVATLTAPTAGLLHIHVTHKRNAKMLSFATGRGVEILPDSGSSKLFTVLVQRQLLKLHFYMPQSGVWDLQTELAVEAYHRLINRGTSTDLDPATLNDLLNGEGTFVVRYPKHGEHAEGNLSDQLLALIDGSKVQLIYPISSGKPSTPTILGNYQVYLRTPGYLPDGMYYSDFFIRGYAIHGYDPAPDYPASHGCMRLPISDAISAFDWLKLGDWVDVYGAPTGLV